MHYRTAILIKKFDDVNAKIRHLTPTGGTFKRNEMKLVGAFTAGLARSLSN